MWIPWSVYISRIELGTFFLHREVDYSFFILQHWGCAKDKMKLSWNHMELSCYQKLYHWELFASML